MKFNDSQKKWAMTGVLLATLGFNISPPKSMKSFTLLDMASSEEVKVDKITNERGVFKVVYRASGKDKTIAEVSQVYTEAGATAACDDCMSAIVLNKPIASKIDELNLVTAKAMSNLGGPAAKADVEKEEREETPAREERTKPTRKTEVAKKSKNSKPDGVALLKEDIESLCSDMSAKETVSCVSDLAQDMFKNYEKYSINKTGMVTLLNAKMLRPLSSEIADIRRDNSWDFNQSVSDSAFARQMEEAVETSLTPLSDLIVEVVDKDASLARDLATKYTTLLEASKKAKSTAETSGKYQEARLRWEDSTLANYKISKVVAEGMQQGNEFSSALQRQLDAYLQSSMQTAQTTGQSTVVDAQGNTWVRTDMAGRGYTQVGTPTSMGNSVVPQGIPTGGSFPQPIVPTAPAGTGTMRQVQPVPQTFVQPQVQQQYQPQQYQQQFAQPQMYQQQGFVNPQMQQQYGTTVNQPGVINMNTASGATNQPGVINMGATNGTGRVGY